METITSLKVDLILPFIQSNFVQLTPVMIIIIGYSLHQQINFCQVVKSSFHFLPTIPTVTTNYYKMHLRGGGSRGHSMTLTSLQSWPTHYESVLEEYVNLEHPQP